MREIKFRGKRLDNNEWVYGFGSFMWEDDGFQKAEIYSTYGVYEVNPETVGQYTGLKDKNGRDIYEGDIVKSPYGIGEVKWLYEHCSYVVYERYPEPKYVQFESDGQLKETEVIGNIYDNPELLEGGE